MVNLPVTLSGTVTKFKGDGRKLGYPTANITTKTDLKDGVYFGYADLAAWKHNPALIFIGTPTTMGETTRRVEAYLLDIPDQDYYDRPLRLTVLNKYRDNTTFGSQDELMAAMREDEMAGRRWFSSGSGRL